MCDPITIAGIALTAGSTVANTMAASKAQGARDDALAAERIRQRGFDDETSVLNEQSRARYDDFEGQQDAKANELGQYFSSQQVAAGDQNAAATAETTVPQSGSDLTVREEAKQRGQARDFTDKTGAALGNLRAFGDVLGNISRGQARDASLIGQIGGFKQGSSNVVPLELDQANQAGNGLKLFGDILGLGGSIAVGKGLSGSSVPSIASKGVAGAGTAANGKATVRLFG